MSKFNALHESTLTRYTQGAGFLAGDVVKFNGKKTLKSEWFENKPAATQTLVKELFKIDNNLRIGYLHKEFPHAIGGFGANWDGQYQYADVYVELSPANWTHPITVPLNLLVRVEPKGSELAPIPDSIKDKKVRTEKNGKKGKANSQTKIDDKNRQYATANTKLPNSSKWDDSKVGGGNLQNMPGTKMQESVEHTLENAYTQVLNEKAEKQNKTPVITEASDSYNQCEYTLSKSGVSVTFEDTVHSPVHNDEIPVTVTANYRHHEAQDATHGKTLWELGRMSVVDENGKPVTIHNNDEQYLKDRADDFIGRYKDYMGDLQADESVVDEAIGNPDTLDVNGHTVTKSTYTVGKEEPSECEKFEFDNGYKLIQMYGVYEILDSNGKRIKHTDNTTEINKTLHTIGLPVLDDIYSAFQTK